MSSMNLNIRKQHKNYNFIRCKTMSIGGIYNFISLGITVLSGVIITLSIYYLYLRAKSEKST